MFAPLMMMLMFIACMAMMFFMMRSHRRSGPDADDALAILKSRYARGDITLAEFEDRRRVVER